MKLRQGFVSNSSSTSFYMIVKGNSIENLFSMLKKYGDYFNLSYEDCNGKLLRCTYTDIISELKTVGIDNFFTLNSLIKDSIHRIKFDEELLIIEKLSGNNKWPLEHYKKSISDQEKKINIFMEAKRKGFTRLLKVDFGDNNGDISGGNIGTAMDYEGRKIRINTSDFIVFTEQNR